MNKEEAQALWIEVQRNHKALNECPGHSFVAMGQRSLMDRYKCRLCGGEIDAVAHHWYQQGVVHTEKKHECPNCGSIHSSACSPLDE